MPPTNETSSKERRRHARLSVRHAAVLESPAAGSLQVVIENYCPGGLFASLMDESPIAEHPSGRRVGRGEQVTVRISYEDGGQHDEIVARVARVGEMGFGLAFLQLNQTVADRLSAVAERQGFSSDPEAPQPGKEKRGHVVRQLASLAHRYLERHTKDTFEACKDALLTAAGDASGDLGQTPYFEAMSLLRKNGDHIVSGFVNRLDQHLNTFETLRPISNIGADTQEGEELSLVDDQEFETWLSVSEIIASAENRNNEQLHALDARLSEVTGKQINNRNNPLGPAALCHHFFEALETLELAHNPAQVLWRTFGKVFGGNLKSLYQDANKLLVEAGILPNLVFTPLRPRRAPGPRPPAAQAPLPDAAAPSEGDAPAGYAEDAGYAQQPGYAGDYLSTPPATAANTAKIIDLQQLLRRRGQGQPGAAPAGGPPAGGAPAAGPAPAAFGMEELHQALRDLQAAKQRDRQQNLSQRLGAALRKRFGQDDDRVVLGNPAEAVDLTEQMMDTIGNDSVVGPRAKGWIQQLEVQLLRMLMQEQDVINDPQHPARQVLNHLGQAVVSRAKEMTSREEKLINQIDHIVNDLSGLTDPDREAFEDAAKQLEKLLKRQHRLRATQLKRVLEAAEGQQRLEQAREKVQTALNQRFAGRQVPKPVVDLLKLGYRNLLDVEAVRTGVEGPDWDKAFSLVSSLDEKLADDYQPQENDPQTSAELLENISDRLSHVQADAAEQKDLLADLKKVLPGISEERAEAERVEFKADAPRETVPEPDDSDPDTAHWLGMAKMMDKGSWMLFPGADSQPQPIKLAWISDERDRYVFVNRNGQKELEISPAELADHFRDKKAEMIDQPDQPLMDRTYHGMVQHMHDQMAHQATHDLLTEALNRKEFERQIRLKLGESKLMHTQHIALQVEIDQFKVVNTTAGHDAGDRLLQDLSRAMRKQLSDDASLARLGGDTFAVLLARCEPAPGHEAAEKLRRAINEHRTRWKRRKLKATASIGLVAIDRSSESVSQILNQMESACSAAKDAGRDRIKSYQIDDQELSQRDLAMRWVTELESALDNDRIELFAQRILPLSSDSGGREHFEILSRMRTEDGELVQPNQFIPAAEAYGRIHYLDEWVFRSAFAMLNRSPRKDKIARLSINLSGKTFGRPRFLTFIQQLFEDTGVEPSKICFEITETAAISNLSRCTDFLRELRYLGCRFSLDDFGTGLSSFSYLKHLPVDYLKIDGSFIKDLVNSTADYGLVKTINEIGHFLGKETVAEFVESEEILEHLREIGLDFAQGYGIEKPRPLEDVLGLMPDSIN